MAHSSADLFAHLAAQPHCPACRKPEIVCVCSLLTPAKLGHQLLVLQHPQEDDHLLGTVPLLRAGLDPVTVRVGLSWASLSQASGSPKARAADWALVFPQSGAKAAAPKARKTSKVGAPAPAARTGKAPPLTKAQFYAATGKPLPYPPRLRGLILLDGTWKQAKTLLWRNPWLRKLPRLSLAATNGSIYGRLRREPRTGLCSTLEAAVMALHAVGEPPAPSEPLLRALRTLAQRLRDARVQPSPEVAPETAPELTPEH